MNKTNLKAIPTFRIFDYQKAIEFYIEELGFTIDWEHRFGPEEPVYMQISKNGLVLHLSENSRFKLEVIIFVETEGLEEFYQELTQRTSKIKIPKPEKTDWQSLQMEIKDPFGNLLRFNESLDNLKQSST